MRMLFCIGCLFSCLATMGTSAVALVASKEERIAKLYEVGKTDGEPIYIQKIVSEDQEPGTRLHKSTIHDAQGKLVMTETATLINSRVVQQRIDNLIENVSFELNVKDGKAEFFTYKMVNGERGELDKKKSRTLPENYIFGPSTQSFLQINAEAFKRNDSLQSQFGVFEISDFIGMSFRKLKGKDGDKNYMLEMKPSSFFISAFILDPILLEVDPTTFQLIRYKGRTPIKRAVKGKLKPWDAEILYSAVSPAQ